MISMDEPVYFNGVNLYSIAGLRVTGIDTFRYPNRNVQNSALAFADNSVTTSSYFNNKPINIRGVIAVSGRELLDTQVDSLRQAIDGQNKVLKVIVENSYRLFNKCTVKNIALSNQAGGYIEFDIEFVSAEPYSFNTTTTEVLNISNLTSGDKSYPVTFYGTATQVPIITYTLTSFTNGTNKTVTFIDPLNSRSLSVQRTWTAAEVLVIDNLNQTVKVNGTAVDFTGNFMSFATGANFINYTDDFSTRSVNINVVYTKRYK